MSGSIIDVLFKDALRRRKCENTGTVSNKEKIKHIKRVYFDKNEKLYRFQFWSRVRSVTGKLSIWGGVSRIYMRRYQRIYSVSNSTTSIGPGFHLVHGTNIYINAESIGSNFTIFQGVTIGVDRHGKRPTIGSNVTIYTNAVVCGGIKVGNNSIIGPNAFVNRDLPDNSMVINECIYKTLSVDDGK